MPELPPGDPRHGTENGYVNLGCRCQDCRAAWSLSCRQHRQRRAALITPDDPRHGRASFYSNHGCRCQPCRKAHSEARTVRPVSTPAPSTTRSHR